MAIRKDLDDMLNSLMDGGGGGSTPARSHNTPRSVRKSKFDDMSVDDLLHALEDEKKHYLDDAAPTEEYHEDTPPSVWEFAPPTEKASEPEMQAEEEEVPNIISEVMHTEASAETTRVFDAIPMSEELPKPVKKKKIVITGELPDYEALRREEAERERQAQLASEAAAEEARAAERARRAAEAAAERQRLAEEAEQRRLAREEAERQRIAEEEERSRRIAEAAAEKKRLAEEAAERRRLEEEAERQRLAEEAERQRIAEEEAERQRLAEEAERQRIAEEEAERQRLAEEAERQRIAEEEAKYHRIDAEEEKLRQIEEMKRLAEEIEGSAPETVVSGDISTFAPPAEKDVDEAIEALGEAASEAVPEIQEEETEKPKKLGFFKKLMNKGKEEPKPDTDTDPVPEDGLFESDESPSATELIDAAIAAINHPEDSESTESYSDPVGNMLDNIREDAAEAIADMDTPKEEAAEAPSEPLVLSDEDIIAGLSPELKERFDELSADKQQQVIEMRRAQMGAVAPAVVSDEEPAEDSFITEEEDVSAAEDTEMTETSAAEEVTEKAETEAEKASEPTETAPQKPKGKITSALGRILDEDPDELIAQRSEHTESDELTAGDPYKRKRLFTVLGVIFTIFAVIGIIATIIKCVGFFRSFTSGEAKKDSFTQMIYPAAIMDIEPFSDPSQLTSEQIITATIWSIIMDESKISKYELTLDTVSIPDVDVEKYAVELFGENLPPFEHATVGPIESRFYYADGVYNVRSKPITHTYSPEIKSIVKNGNTYTLNVDYVDELPQWMDKNVSKNVEFRLTEKDDGTFKFSSMKIISVNNGNI
ncbi:hypothetical protein SAMN02910265_02106 [Ruminococcus flavefaciens]|uniref:Uncharacterized protein n=1 Tax=Ruminococcus flavefaciens TaxID=1265 RepID=A0A1H6K517_RUMFL|nr:hypothetical protein [Ruminococcus flavefaciens]SEH68392.1 hypothetical protein SAMN02910265_02106 [Ruminococcus flavefaciens]